MTSSADTGVFRLCYVSLTSDDKISITYITINVFKLCTSTVSSTVRAFL